MIRLVRGASARIMVQMRTYAEITNTDFFFNSKCEVENQKQVEKGQGEQGESEMRQKIVKSCGSTGSPLFLLHPGLPSGGGVRFALLGVPLLYNPMLAVSMQPCVKLVLYKILAIRLVSFQSLLIREYRKAVVGFFLSPRSSNRVSFPFVRQSCFQRIANPWPPLPPDFALCSTEAGLFSQAMACNCFAQLLPLFLKQNLSSPSSQGHVFSVISNQLSVNFYCSGASAFNPCSYFQDLCCYPQIKLWIIRKGSRY